MEHSNYALEQLETIFKDETQPVKVAQKALLEHTARSYNEYNRAVLLGMCVYHKTDTSPGCAIGKWLPEDVANNISERWSAFVGSQNYRTEKYLEKIPTWLTRLGTRFLVRLQDLHDDEAFWLNDGLSSKGEVVCRQITVEYGLDTVEYPPIIDVDIVQPSGDSITKDETQIELTVNHANS